MQDNICGSRGDLENEDTKQQNGRILKRGQSRPSTLITITTGQTLDGESTGNSRHTALESHSGNAGYK